MSKILKQFNLNFSDLPSTATNRVFTIIGDEGAEFMLEIIRQSDSKYYNFATNAWVSTKSNLNAAIQKTSYKGSIKFEAVGSAIDQYNINFWAILGTEHAEYNEVRFADGSVDINSSTGSNSLLVKKVIYQNLDTTLTLTTYSPSDTANVIQENSKVNSVITASPYHSKLKQSFTISCEVNNVAQSYQIIKQPAGTDVLAFNQLTVGSAPELLPGENEYPAVNSTDTVNGAIAGGGSRVKVVMDTRVAETIVVGDKITAPISTDTVDGAIDSSSSPVSKIVMDNNVAGKMAVGDRVTAIGASVADEKFFIANIVIVAALDPDGDNAKEFSTALLTHDGDAAAITVADGTTLTFTPHCNASLTTVAALNPDGDNTLEFSMSQNVGFIDGVTLSFSNRKNKQWPLDNIQNVTEGMQVFPGNTADVNKTENLVADSKTAKYEDTVTLNEGTSEESIIIKNSAPFKTTKNQTPTITNGVVTTQEGNIVFNNQQALALAGDTIYIGGYGTGKINEVNGYSIKLTNLKIELDTITTTTTAAVVNSTTVPVASVNGILPGVSTVSGIGINASVADPTVNNRNVTSGAGELTLSAAQNLESGVTLTFDNAGQKATITGDIEVLKTGKINTILKFDVEKLLSIT